MTVEELIKKLEEIAEDVEKLDIVKDFQIILDRLEFILFDCREVINNISNEEKQDNIMDINTLKIMFLAEIIKKYLEVTTKDNYKYEINDMYFMGQTSGYNPKDDTVILSPLGMSLNSISDMDIMKTIFHEFRHQRQYHYQNINNFEDLLKYPAKFIRIIKNKVPKDVFEKTDEQGKIIESPYYNINYSKMYVEVDADIIGLYLPKKMIYDMYELSSSKGKVIRDKVRKIQEFIILNSGEVEELLQDQNRLQPIYKEEVNRMIDITSKVTFRGKDRDSLLFVDKCLKENDVDYPVFDLFKVGNRYKNYIEIIKDKNDYITMYNEEDKINNIYNYYINSDPILIVSDYIFKNDINKIKEFLQIHPTFKKEYKEEIFEMVKLMGGDSNIIDLLLDEKQKNSIRGND